MKALFDRVQKINFSIRVRKGKGMKNNLFLLGVCCLIFSVTRCHAGSAILEGDFREVFVNEENSWYLDMGKLKPLVLPEGENGWEVYLKRDYKTGAVTEVYQVLFKKNPPSFKLLDSYAFDIDGDLVDQ